MTQPVAFRWVRLVAVVAGGLFLIGALVLLVPAHVESVSCGSALSPSNQASRYDAGRHLGEVISGREESADITVTACDDALDGRRVLGWPALILGGLVVVGVLVARSGGHAGEAHPTAGE